jgi:SAM-dependent methyltransferase
MASQYDSIGLAYESMKHFPASILERNTFESVISPLLSSRKDIRILDLACGTGYYTRLLQEWGGASVSEILGIDLSPVMIEAARASLASSSPSQTQSPEGALGKITFQVGDCIQPLVLSSAPFEAATGAWLLNYASSHSEMTSMWQNISRNLRDDTGVFVGIVPYPASDLDAFAASFSPATNPSAANDGEKYGVSVQYTSKLASGQGYATKITGHTSPAEIVFENFHLRRDVYEKSAREGGMMGELVWIEPRLPQTDQESWSLYGVDRAWWVEYQIRTHFGILVVRKS